MTEGLLDRLLKKQVGKEPFALIYRPHVTGPGIMEMMSGKVTHLDMLQSIPLVDSGHDNTCKFTLVIVPYRQLKERGFSHIDDGSPLITMIITEYKTISVTEILDSIPDTSIQLHHGSFDISDYIYEDIVRSIKENEIGNGAGSNFVIKRTFMADITEYTLQHALSIFRNLLDKEIGAYWTFIIHTGERTFIGASPELHVSLNNEMVLMNPISGTYRYPSTGPTFDGIMDFLATRKEADELYMVVEEELKMVSRFCPNGGKITGPFLKEMSRLAHTEYFIQGSTICDPRDILRETLFAPTVTGSPIENACRVITKYEKKGRGYYAGIVALMGRDILGKPNLDSAILIRTADINSKGNLQISVGATIVSHSDPKKEVEETSAKAKALLDAIVHKRGI